MKETFPKDDFGVIVENNNGKEIIDYLASKGFDKYYLSGTAGDNSFYSVLKGDKYISCSSGKYFSKTYTLQELKQLDMNQIDYTIPGTKLPRELKNIEYRCANWDSSMGLSRNDFSNQVSYGSKEYKGETYILSETIGYKGHAFFMFKLTDLQKLTNQNMEEQEIEGYRLVKKIFLNAVKEITNYRNFKYVELEESRIWAVHNNPNPTACYTSLKEAGVLDLWFEPVYKAKEQIISMNGKFNLTIKDKKVFHKSEDLKDFPIKLVNYFKDMKIGENNYPVVIKEVIFESVGCEKNKETKLSDWKKLLENIT